MSYVRSFGASRVPDGEVSKALLGGKGAGLATMSRLGLPVPPGFTITTDASGYFLLNDGAWPGGLKEEVAAAVSALEAASGKSFGDANDPLLVSVRSGPQLGPQPRHCGGLGQG
jgi:pyruvate,orthophosphate dikinase